MKTVIVASTNPVKLRAVQMGFARMFPGQPFQFRAVSAPSGVADQPFSDRETLQGALNRALGAQALAPEADFWAGIEGGVAEEALEGVQPAGLAHPSPGAAPLAPGLSAFAWVVVVGKPNGKAQGEVPGGVPASSGAAALVGRGRTGAFTLPPRVAELVRAGKELGEADDIVFGRANSKQENGAVGLLTGDAIDRAAFYEHAVVLALIPFKREDLWTSQS